LGSWRQRQVGLPHLECAVEIVPGRMGPCEVMMIFSLDILIVYIIK